MSQLTQHRVCLACFRPAPRIIHPTYRCIHYKKLKWSASNERDSRPPLLGNLPLSHTKEHRHPWGQASSGQPGAGSSSAQAPRTKLYLVRSSLSPTPTRAEHNTAWSRPARASSLSRAFPVNSPAGRVRRNYHLGLPKGRPCIKKIKI